MLQLPTSKAPRKADLTAYIVGSGYVNSQGTIDEDAVATARDLDPHVVPALTQAIELRGGKHMPARDSVEANQPKHSILVVVEMKDVVPMGVGPSVDEARSVFLPILYQDIDIENEIAGHVCPAKGMPILASARRGIAPTSNHVGSDGQRAVGHEEEIGIQVGQAARADRKLLTDQYVGVRAERNESSKSETRRDDKQ
jgi:hypothetical protein